MFVLYGTIVDVMCNTVGVLYHAWAPVVLVLMVATLELAFTVVNNGFSAYTINNVDNPTLSLTRGVTYRFLITTPGHPFWIKTAQGAGTGNAYSNGVSSNGVTTGAIIFTVPGDAPSTLYYNCQYHSPMTGVISVSGGLLLITRLDTCCIFACLHCCCF